VLDAGFREAMNDDRVADHLEGSFAMPATTGGPVPMTWTVEGIAPTAPARDAQLAQGARGLVLPPLRPRRADRHQLHAGDSPLLRRRILDVGCGDGITDLSVALRTRCAELVGIDPYRGYERLPQIIEQNGLPPDVIPPNLRFLPESANAIPFADDSFDVVISWGSVEHIAAATIRRCARFAGC
jgi:2-polyprenyl-3-methyl-5-hydroxy-6-metoxy-1,4-benzoquinol methylase